MFTAYGRRYTADGWGPETALFSFECPSHNTTAQHAWAQALARNDAAPYASHGTEDVTAVRCGQHAPELREKPRLKQVVRKLWASGWSISQMEQELRLIINLGNTSIADLQKTIMAADYVVFDDHLRKS